MNQDTALPEADDPLLSALIAEEDDAWNEAYPVLYGIAEPIIRSIMKGVSDDILGDIFLDAVAELRKGLTVKRSSLNPTEGKSWKKLKDFQNLKRLFARMIRCDTKDYIDKHKNEFPFDDALDHADPSDPQLDLEWDRAFKKAVSKIRTIHRDVMIAMDIMGYDTHQVMRMYNLPKGTVGVYVKRGKEELRAAILSDPELKEILWPKIVQTKKDE